MQNNTKVDFANTLRGFAAFSVLVWHYCGVFWLDRVVAGELANAPTLAADRYATPHWISLLNAIPVFNWGPYGVALFFIISGFVIPFSLQKTSSLGFLISRFLRVFPTYFVGFSVTLLAIFFSTQYFAKNWPYTLNEVLIQYIPGIRDILWSKNIDGIIWTLEIEVKFYLLCALLIGLFRRYSILVFWVPIVLVMIAGCLEQEVLAWLNKNPRVNELIVMYGTVSQFILFMFIGVMFHYMYQKRVSLRKGYACIGMLFILFCLAWFIGPLSGAFNLVWSYAFALLTFIFAYTFPSLFRGNRVTNFLADISYPFYVIHGVAGYVVLRIMLDRGVKVSVALGVVTSVAVLLAWLIHVTVENPSRVLGKKLGAQLTSTTKGFALSSLNKDLS